VGRSEARSERRAMGSREPILRAATGYMSAIGGTAGLGVNPWWNHIWLPNSFSVQTVVHELGHVLDNNYWELGDRLWPFPPTYAGGGLADFMVYSMGGDPSQCIPRWSCANVYASIAGMDPWKSAYYGSNSIADDFAETFMNTIFGNYVPEGRSDWMENFLGL